MRTNPIYLGALAALISFAGCSDTSGPSYADLEIIVDWPRLDEEGFVGHDYSFWHCWPAGGGEFKTECETLAEGPIPADWDRIVHARAPCPLGALHTFQVNGYFEANGPDRLCGAQVLLQPECTDRPQVFSFEDWPTTKEWCTPPE